ncbi:MULTISPECIES: hypothetical protein [Mycobacteriaceae]|nr:MULTISPECIES: hypothetical protein [Mycobacteriaceae]
MPPIALWVDSAAPGSRYPDAQHRIISHRVDVFDWRLSIRT